MVNGAVQKPAENGLEPALVRALGSRSIVLVGMMGAGKSSIGRRLAGRLGIPFIDADTEIENAAGMTIPEIFDKHGEPYFRAGEKRVIARLLDNGPQVLATGGGAVMDQSTRDLIHIKGISVWLRADLDCCSSVRSAAMTGHWRRRSRICFRSASRSIRCPTLSCNRVTSLMRL